MLVKRPIMCSRIWQQVSQHSDRSASRLRNGLLILSQAFPSEGVEWMVSMYVSSASNQYDWCPQNWCDMRCLMLHFSIIKEWIGFLWVVSLLHWKDSGSGTQLWWTLHERQLLQNPEEIIPLDIRLYTIRCYEESVWIVILSFFFFLSSLFLVIIVCLHHSFIHHILLTQMVSTLSPFVCLQRW